MRVLTPKQSMIMRFLILPMSTIYPNNQVQCNKNGLDCLYLDLYPYSVCLQQAIGCTTGDLAVLYGFVWGLFPTQR